ncbi:MAG TPA: CCA tRNA nucleotidyltransferase [Caulobacteraceae bacterium]|jgi:poly(A) polymerase
MTRLDAPWLRDPAARAVLDALEAEGGPDSARFVGGCVRNTLMGQRVEDVDIATRLTPDRTIAALERARLKAVPTGVEHGTVTAVADHRPFEITTLRRDVETDGRRAVVAFTEDWAEDAARRDFRLNALYADREGQVYDPTGGGLDDAHAGRIVFVGEAETRIREDYLRILRFFRFFAWYGRGHPEAEGLAACARLKDGVTSLSAERVSKELLKLLAARDPRRSLSLMADAGVLPLVLPEAANWDRFRAIVVLTSDPELRLAALLPDDPALAQQMSARLRLSNAQRDRLVEALRPARSFRREEGRATLYRLGPAVFRDRVYLQWAERPEMEPEARELLDLSASWNPPRFPLTGEDVMAAGVTKGPEVGRTLRALEDEWIASGFGEDREALLRRLAR